MARCWGRPMWGDVVRRFEIRRRGRQSAAGGMAFRVELPEAAWQGKQSWGSEFPRLRSGFRLRGSNARNRLNFGAPLVALLRGLLRMTVVKVSWDAGINACSTRIGSGIPLRFVPYDVGSSRQQVSNQCNFPSGLIRFSLTFGSDFAYLTLWSYRERRRWGRSS
jgi:hypothetical protein